MLKVSDGSGKLVQKTCTRTSIVPAAASSLVKAGRTLPPCRVPLLWRSCAGKRALKPQHHFELAKKSCDGNRVDIERTGSVASTQQTTAINFHWQKVITARLPHDHRRTQAYFCSLVLFRSHNHTQQTASSMNTTTSGKVCPSYRQKTGWLYCYCWSASFFNIRPLPHKPLHATKLSRRWAFINRWRYRYCCHNIILCWERYGLCCLYFGRGPTATAPHKVIHKKVELPT